MRGTRWFIGILVALCVGASLTLATAHMEGFVVRSDVERVAPDKDSDYVEAEGFPQPIWITGEPLEVRFDGVGPDGRLFLLPLLVNFAAYIGFFGIPLALLSVWAFSRIVSRGASSRGSVT